MAQVKEQNPAQAQNNPNRNGSVGGYMVKKMIEEQEKQMSGR